MLYFAYGSNMLASRLRDPQRAPSAKLYGIGALHHHRIAFHKRGRDGSGKCNAIFTGCADNCVWGVLYTLPDRDLDALDHAEDTARGGYARRTLDIRIAPTNTVEAAGYVAGATFIDDSLYPFDWYVAFVVEGARRNQLPQDYIARLVEHPTQADADVQRRRTAEFILNTTVPA